MENNKYGYRNINELISEIEALGDWRDITQRDKFLKVLSKIAKIYYGYNIKGEDGEVTTGYYPKEVFDAIIEVCKAKFPIDSENRELFDDYGRLKKEYPEYFTYLFCVKDYIRLTRHLSQDQLFAILAMKEFGIEVDCAGTATKEEVDELIASSKEYLEKKKEQKLNVADSNPERQEKEESIRKSQEEKQAIKKQISEIDKEIEDLTSLLKQKKAQRDDLSRSLEGK